MRVKCATISRIKASYDKPDALLPPHTPAGKGDNPSGRKLLRELVAHKLHIGLRMAEKVLKPLTERTFTIPVAVTLKAVLGTFTPTSEVEIAAKALRREPVAFGQTEVVSPL